jgi:hypothetical protein
VRTGLRIQIIWKTYEGGDHFDHVHVGVRLLPSGQFHPMNDSSA